MINVLVTTFVCLGVEINWRAGDEIVSKVLLEKSIGSFCRNVENFWRGDFKMILFSTIYSS